MSTLGLEKASASQRNTSNEWWNSDGELVGIWEGIWGHFSWCHMDARGALPVLPEGKVEKTKGSE